MDNKLKGFFDTATQKAQTDTVLRDAAAEKEARRKAAQDENARLLDTQVKEEIGCILDALKALPEKDGLRFGVNIQDRSFRSDADVTRYIGIAYMHTRKSSRHDDFRGDYAEPRPEIGLQLTLREGGQLDITVIQYSMVEFARHSAGRSHRSRRCKDFEEVRKELGEGIAHIAAARLEEIAEALGAAQPDPAAANQIGVFARPLQFKNAAAAASPPAPVAAEEQKPAATKPFWRRALGL